MAVAGSSTGGAGGSGGNPGYQPCPTNGEPCRILPFGDSITDGVGVTGGGGYRIELFSKALEAGKDITFTGGQMNGPQMVDGVPFPRRHEGHSGWRIAQLQPLIPQPAFEPLPHIVLLHIGTNDIAQNDDLAQAPTRVGALIDDIVEAAPEALVVVAKIIPLSFGGGNAIESYNDALEQIVAARASAGKHVLMVDQNTGFPNGELADGVHPNAQGYARMANVWWASIEALIP
jgi:lysophospholipase L1-like esterase